MKQVVQATLATICCWFDYKNSSCVIQVVEKDVVHLYDYDEITYYLYLQQLFTHMTLIRSVSNTTRRFFTAPRACLKEIIIFDLNGIFVKNILHYHNLIFRPLLIPHGMC